MFYQWGRKDTFTFANKANGTNRGGSNPLKIYNAQGKEIVQTINGDTDTNGGIIILTEQASSMLEIVKKPNTFYAAGVNSAVINQSGLTKDVFDYYWTSYSRGTDGNGKWRENGDPNFNNVYLNGYNQKRAKSIYDPCPYGFRLPVNGVWNKFPKQFQVWLDLNYTGGGKFFSNWFQATGRRTLESGILDCVGYELSYMSVTVVSRTTIYGVGAIGGSLAANVPEWAKSYGFSVRCIEAA